MGFIERLREEKKAREDTVAREALERDLRQKLRQEAIKKAHDQLRQQEEEEKRRHEERNLHARQFQRESGIIPLAEETERLLGGGGEWEGSPDYQLRDGDSAVFLVEWGWHYNYSRKLDGNHYIYPQKVSGSGKYFAIETCPDGTIVFHASRFGSSSVSQEKWRNNKELLEVALERAYDNHRIHSWKYRRPSYDNSSNYFFSDR